MKPRPPRRPKSLRPPHGGHRPARDTRGPARNGPPRREGRPYKPFAKRGADGARGDDRGAFIARGVRIVHEDEDIIILDKPTGLVTADPSRAASAPRGMNPAARFGQTLFDFVKGHVRRNTRAAGRKRPKPDDEAGEDRPGRVWIVHRLDKEASGLVVFAKTVRGYDALKEQFRTKAAHRIYLAVAEGKVGDAGFASTHQSFISENRGPRGAGPESGGGRDKQFAVTHYRVVGIGNDRSLLQVRLDTGRKNQIRVHMQELGHPLVGDSRFGAATNPIGRLGLHAVELGLVHPATKMTVRYNSPAPASFYRAVGMEPVRGATEAEPDRRAEPEPRDRPPDAAVGDDTSWDDVAQWYDTLLGDRGNDHYEQTIIPATMRLLGAVHGKRILDVACGQGILSRRLAAAGAAVTGVDASARLIEAAKGRSPEIDYRVADARELEPLGLRDFDAAACIMALGNIDPIDSVFGAIAQSLKPGGVFVALISHPAFRNPGWSSWNWDESLRRQYRRVDAYLTPARREIAAHPGRAAREGDTTATTSFHRPIGMYVNALAEAGLRIDRVEELISMRAASSGPRAPEENRARTEIPLFMAIRTIKRE